MTTGDLQNRLDELTDDEKLYVLGVLVARVPDDVDYAIGAALRWREERTR
jgi:hypothetical protein